MTIVSLKYFAFLFFSVLIYYILPKKIRCGGLLLSSVAFYLLSANPFTVFFLVGEAILSWSTALFGAKMREKGKSDTVPTAVCASVIALIWVLLKGSRFLTVAGLKPLGIPEVLGMSYFSLQLIGYVLDCHWQVYTVEKNPFRLLLFTLFFPQLTSGPIHRSETISEMWEGKSFDAENLIDGTERIMWGLCKKLVLSERLAVAVNFAWESDTKGWALAAILIYPLQLYTDFSGCMDIVIGSARLFGISIPENFNTPFFSKSIQEIWQRWHITLGGWAKNYIFYPVLKSAPLQKLSEKARAKLGKKAGKAVTTSLALFFLWLFMGIWHGAWQYVIGESLFFWLCIVLSLFLEPTFGKWKKKLKINEKTLGWHIFSSVRTYILFAVGILFFRAPTFVASLKFIGEAVVSPVPHGLPELGIADTVIIIAGILLLFLVGILNENRKNVFKTSLALKCVAIDALFALVILFGCYGLGFDAAGFIYGTY